MASASETGRATKEFELDDPLELVGVGLEEPPDDAALDEMACSIVEEYMRMGWTGDNILRLFRNPAFHMTHNILRLKGEAYVQGLAASVDQMRSEVQRSGDGS